MAREEREEILRAAIEQAGGPAELARFITENYEAISAQAICDWKRCPPLRAMQVEHAIRERGGKITTRELRPDVFGTAPKDPNIGDDMAEQTRAAA